MAGHRLLASVAAHGRWKTSLELPHLLVGRRIAGREVRAHQRLPALVDGFVLHRRDGIVQGAGGLEVAEQGAVVVEEQRVILPTAAPKCVEHLRPHRGVVGDGIRRSGPAAPAAGTRHD